MKEKVEELKRYAVRLKSGNNNLGSGVLWKPRLCQKHNLYIFTAAHVIKNQENILVEFERDEGTIELAINELEIVCTEHGCENAISFDKENGTILLHYIYDDTYCKYYIVKKLLKRR